MFLQRGSPPTVKKIVYNPLVMLLLGLAAGALTRLADIYTQILCSVFSELSVWILVGVVIVLGCDSRRRACLDIFLFCAGMLITYYLVAEYTNGIWGWSFVYGWAAFTLLTPVLAYLTWFVKSGGVFGRLISVGIILVTLISSVFYGGPHFYDIIICLALAYLLFVKKIRA